MDALFYFYSTSAQISFILLGFWWAIVTFKHQEWMNDPNLRRMSHYISLNFLMPGVLSLVSLLAVDNSVLWRSGFCGGGIFGMFAAGVSYVVDLRRGAALAVGGQGGGAGHEGKALRWLALALVYGLIAIVALGGPSLTDALGLGREALKSEGVLVGLLLLLGAEFAWALFSDVRGRPVSPG